MVACARRRVCVTTRWFTGALACYFECINYSFVVCRHAKEKTIAADSRAEHGPPVVVALGVRNTRPGHARRVLLAGGPGRDACRAARAHGQLVVGTCFIVHDARSRLAGGAAGCACSADSGAARRRAHRPRTKHSRRGVRTELASKLVCGVMQHERTHAPAWWRNVLLIKVKRFVRRAVL